MLILQKPSISAQINIRTDDSDVDRLLSKEWLLSNSRGGYSSSTVCGCNTRRYHGLLVGSLSPPVSRITALAGCIETVKVGEKAFSLSAFEFDKMFSPGSFDHLKRFRKDLGACFDYEIGKIKLTKSIYLLRESDTVMIEYDFTNLTEAAELILRPLVGLRDFHSLQRSSTEMVSRSMDEGVLIYDRYEHNCELFIGSGDAEYRDDPQWWYNFIYRSDRARGQEFGEDLWTPGIFISRLEGPGKVVFKAALRQYYDSEAEADGLELDIEAVRKKLSGHKDSITAAVKNKDRQLEMLYLAADQFVTTRRIDDSSRTTILAGYPWFADWGRDAFISLPGLLLTTGRFAEAGSVLSTFAGAADEGMIPNRFDERSDTAYFNSIDGSLWFINAAFEYLKASGDSRTFEEQLLPAICEIIDRYQNGTHFDIHADTDGLITGGSQETQLTWMDARFGGVSFTPRYGKAVEVNALWYNALCLASEFYENRDTEKENHYKQMAEKVRRSFCKVFWNERLGYLNDCVFPDGRADESLRPNQIFAVSLSFSPLERERQRSIVEVVREKLLTPYGLRSLDAADPGYKGMYAGPQERRDGAYHQGTVWAYLMGPFVESFLKVNDFSRKSKRQARGFLEPLLLHLTDEGCLGNIAEIFDGDAPHAPKGCFAQAWSTAELLRAYVMTKSLSNQRQGYQQILQSCR